MATVLIFLAIFVLFIGIIPLFMAFSAMVDTYYVEALLYFMFWGTLLFISHWLFQEANDKEYD